jgi:phosphonate transport system substrate-binding protein
MRDRAILIVMIVIGCCLSAPSSAQEGTPNSPVRIGFNGGENPGIIKLKANAFCAFLQERSGVVCKPYIAESYSQLIRAIAEESVDFSFLSPLGLITAEQVAGAQILLKSVRNDQSYYWSVLLVRKDSGLKNLNDLKGRSLAFTHLGSTSGYVIPMSSLMNQGIDPDKYFSEVVYAGGHTAVIRMILDGEVDAGATFADDPRGVEGSWTAEEFLPARESRQLKPIFFSEKIPGDNFSVTRRMLKDWPGVVKLLKEKLMAMGESSTGQTILRDLYNIDSLTEGQNGDYDTVREAFQAVRQR